MGSLTERELFEEAKTLPKDELENWSSSVRWKLDLIIVPLIGFTHGFQFLDKSSLSIASAYNLEFDLHLHGQEFAWCGAIFNFGFLAWSGPTNLLLQRVSVAKYAGAHLILWSLLMMLHATAFNYGSLLAVRFFLGMAEAGIAPVPLTILSMWYDRREMPLRMCAVLSCNGLFYIISALLGYGLGHAMNASIPRWKLIYLTYGGLNFVWGVIFLLVVPDAPSKARFLTHDQKMVAVWRVSKNMVGFRETKFKKSQAIEALTDLKVWMTTLLGLCAGVPLGGVTTFMSALIEGFGYTGIQATKWELPIGAIAFVGIILCGTFATKVPNARCLTIILISLVPFGCLLGLRLIPRHDRWALLGCSWTQLLALNLNCLTWSIMTANFGGHTKRAVANAMWFVFFAAGNIVGNNIFFHYQRPTYYSAIVGLLVCYGSAMLLTGLLWIRMVVDNRERRRMAAVKGLDESSDITEAILRGLKDETDKQSIYFRYSY